MSCGINRRSERNNQETNQIPQLSQHQGYKKSCPFCEKDIKEESIRFCPNCGTKL